MIYRLTQTDETDLPLDQLRIVAAICCILLGFNLLGWLRLFDSMAQFVSLIFETLLEIKEFILVLFIFIISSGSALYLLNLNRIPVSGSFVNENHEETLIVGQS